jgi:hypothetical protein
VGGSTILCGEVDLQSGPDTSPCTRSVFMQVFVLSREHKFVDTAERLRYLPTETRSSNWTVFSDLQYNPYKWLVHLFGIRDVPGYIFCLDFDYLD